MYFLQRIKLFCLNTKYGIKYQKNYPVQWEGKTKGGISKRIFAIIGKILPITYKRLIDKDGIYLNDNQNNQLLVQNDYETNENS